MRTTHAGTRVRVRLPDCPRATIGLHARIRVQAPRARTRMHARARLAAFSSVARALAGSRACQHARSRARSLVCTVARMHSLALTHTQTCKRTDDRTHARPPTPPTRALARSRARSPARSPTGSHVRSAGPLPARALILDSLRRIWVLSQSLSDSLK